MTEREQTLRSLRSLIELSGINHNGTWELANQYWPDPYEKLIVESPWLLVRTPKGMIEMGWRKRVISISWEDTPIRHVLTEDDVTKDETSVHAWNAPKALEYLTSLAKLINKER